MYRANFTWESLLTHFPTINNKIAEPEEFVNQNSKIDIRRGENFEILFELETENLRTSSHIFEGDRKQGEVYYNESEILILDEDSETETKLHKLNLTKGEQVSFSVNPSYPNKKKFVGIVNKIETKISQREASYCLDWIVNLEFDEFITKNCLMKCFSNYMEFDFEFKDTITIGDPLYVTRRSCFFLNISGIKIIIGVLNDNLSEVDKNFKPGFIYYSSDVSEDFRMKFIEGLSFLFGRKITSIGSSSFTADNFLVKYTAVSPYIISETIFKQSSNPPASYIKTNEQGQREFDYSFMENFIEKFICSYDSLKLQHVFWMYWHAFYSPIHTRAGNFGAIIEFMLSQVGVEKSLIHKSTFKPFRIKLLAEFRAFCEENQIVDPEIIKIFENKINDLNKLPIAKTTEKGFIKLGLVMSSFEKLLWKRRHDSAHGNEGDGDLIKLVREVNAILSLCNRTLLKSLDISDNYIDYYNFDYPIKNINDPLESESFET